LGYRAPEVGGIDGLAVRGDRNATGRSPTLRGLSTVLVAVRIGVTVCPGSRFGVLTRADVPEPFRVYSGNHDSEGHLAAYGCTRHGRELSLSTEVSGVIS
jgi:hypothetical protein